MMTAVLMTSFRRGRRGRFLPQRRAAQVPPPCLPPVTSRGAILLSAAGLLRFARDCLRLGSVRIDITPMTTDTTGRHTPVARRPCQPAMTVVVRVTWTLLLIVLRPTCQMTTMTITLTTGEAATVAVEEAVGVAGEAVVEVEVVVGVVVAVAEAAAVRVGLLEVDPGSVLVALRPTPGAQSTFPPPPVHRLGAALLGSRLTVVWLVSGSTPAT